MTHKHPINITKRINNHMMHGATVDLAELSTENISYLIDLLTEELAYRIEHTSPDTTNEDTTPTNG